MNIDKYMKPFIIENIKVADIKTIYRTKTRTGFVINDILYGTGESDGDIFVGEELSVYGNGYITDNGIYIEPDDTNTNVYLYDPLYKLYDPLEKCDIKFENISFNNEVNLENNNYETNPLNYHFIKCINDNGILKPKAELLYTMDGENYYEIDMNIDKLESKNGKYEKFQFEYKPSFLIRSNVAISKDKETYSNEIVLDFFYESLTVSFQIFTNETDANKDIWVEVR